MFTKDLVIQLPAAKLNADLAIPSNPRGLVIFSHGSGSGRLSARNRYVANVICDHGVATLLVDLLTEEEDNLYENRFDIDLLTGRLIQITQWIKEYEATRMIAIAYFGASTGAASALRAASFFGKSIRCVISRGGRPDLAMEAIDKVECPVLLIVGELDKDVIELNKAALAHIKATKEMTIVPGATHLFEEPGRLEQVAELATDWLAKYL